jgi:hypothetical protein
LTDEGKSSKEKILKNPHLAAKRDLQKTINIRQITRKSVHVVMKGKQGTIIEDGQIKNVDDSSSFLKRKPNSFAVSYGECIKDTLKNSIRGEIKEDSSVSLNINETLHKTDVSEKPSSMVKVVPI